MGLAPALWRVREESISALALGLHLEQRCTVGGALKRPGERGDQELRLQESEQKSTPSVAAVHLKLSGLSVLLRKGGGLLLMSHWAVVKIVVKVCEHIVGAR